MFLSPFPRFGSPTVCGGSHVAHTELPNTFVCSEDVTFPVAKRLCNVIGARLCTGEELTNGISTMLGGVGSAGRAE